ncbi:hypothetical protein BDW74DRAFT_176400 [Aspergillus multicolor]|uniref:uncharacterized protein n=1 Tax=Aspergillus multicolor TaxID=41759 RepID=UPI003CCE5106
MASNNHAIVFGAAGLLGWATLNQLLAPSSPFSRITAVLNRPVSESDLHLPSGPDRPTLEIVSGVNLLRGTADNLANQLREKVKDAASITHVFYFVFSPFNGDHIQECTQNCDMVRRVANALNTLAPNLQAFVYPGGSRGYGIYIAGGVFQPPLTESMADTLPEDYAKTVAYPWIRKILTEASEGRGWTWSELCPDAVVGFTPNGSGFSLALHWAQYLSLYAFNYRDALSEGREVEIPYPGNEAGYKSLFTPVSGPTLGKIAIHAAINPKACGGKIINMLDNDKPVSASALWPGIAAWFGLKGVGPVGDADDGLKPGEYIERYSHLFAENGKPKALTGGVGAGNKQLDSFGWWLGFDRQFSAERLRAVGFKEQRDPLEGWLEAFGSFRKAGIIL